VDRNDDGSIRDLVLWTFGNGDQVLSQTKYADHDQINAILSAHFYQFPGFSGSW
jgi:hypothetical protein